MPFFGQRAERFRQNFKAMHFQRRLTGFRHETCSFHADEIAEIKQAKSLHRLSSQLFRLHINLDPAAGITQIEKMTLTHVAVSGNATRRMEARAFCEFFANMRDVAGSLESGSKGFDPAGP